MAVVGPPSPERLLFQFRGIPLTGIPLAPGHPIVQCGTLSHAACHNMPHPWRPRPCALLAAFQGRDTTLAFVALVCAMGREASLAAQDSPRVADVARICAEACKDCEAVCRKHESHHAVCKSCANACAAFSDQVKKVSATA